MMPKLGDQLILAHRDIEIALGPLSHMIARRKFSVAVLAGVIVDLRKGVEQLEELSH
jgi:hypothetical protein